MSSPGEPAPAVNNPFAPYISQIDSMSIEDVVGDARHGAAMSFKEARQPLELIKSFVDQLRFLDGTGLPNRPISKGNSAFQEIVQAVQQIRNFNPSNYGNSNLQRTLIQQLFNGYDNLVDAVLPLLLYSNLRASGIKSAEANIYQVLADVQKQQSETERLVNESKDLLAAQKKLSAEIAITGYGTLFAKEAQEHGNAAKLWLGVTGVLAGLTATAGWWNYRTSVNLLNQFASLPSSQVASVPTSITLQFTVAKVILFTIGLSAAYWSARVYRSHRHNSIVNKHRANALTSFEQFVVSAEDKEVKNAVLLQTTTCIYAPQPTGFSSGNDTDGESSLKILEIFRGFQK
jgi:hypothetical protein